MAYLVARWLETPEEHVRSVLGGHLWRPTYVTMDEKRLLLQKFVAEALADHTRVTTPNSRDDGDDRPLGEPMDASHTSKVEEGIIHEDSEVFVVRGEMLDLEEDLRAALGTLDDFIPTQGAPPDVYQALDAIHQVTVKLHKASGMSTSKPPKLPQ